jgi:protein TonB
VVVEDVKPQYTADAMRARVAGDIKIECVARTDGRVSDIRVVKGLEPSLDKAAADAVSKWRFKPGRKSRKAVPVLISIDLTFTLR